MKIIFLGCLFRKEEEKEILKLSKVGLTNAGNYFQWRLIEGLRHFVSLSIINVLPVGTYPRQYKKLFLKTIKWKDEFSGDNLQVGAINLPLIKQFMRYKKIKKEILKRTKKDKNCVIIIYSPYMSFLKAIYKLDRKIKTVLIVTDLPEFYDLFRVDWKRKIFRKINNFFVYKYLSRIDAFVLITEQMKEPLKVGKRPYVVIEGIAENEEFLNEIGYISGEIECMKKVILYAGTLNYQFGIKNLIDGFCLIENDNYELWICGSGEAEDYIRDICLKDKRIKFFGFLPKSEVIKLQKRATVLVNPRTNEGEYTKYSFPSKTMEYMSVGKPVLMYKLDGIPNEYDKYIYYFNGSSPQDIANKIIEVCEKPESELKYIGKKARNFVLENKNNKVQAEKIIDMIDKMLEKR